MITVAVVYLIFCGVVMFSIWVYLMSTDVPQ